MECFSVSLPSLVFACSLDGGFDWAIAAPCFFFSAAVLGIIDLLHGPV